MIILGRTSAPPISKALVVNLAAGTSTAVLAGAVTPTLPANPLQIGEVWHLWMCGNFVHTAAATPQLNFVLRIFGAGFPLVITPVATAGTFTWECECYFTAITLGATGTIHTSLSVRSFGLTAANAWGGGQRVLTTVDTINMGPGGTIGLEVNMVTAVASNSVTVTQGFVERLFG